MCVETFCKAEAFEVVMNDSVCVSVMREEGCVCVGAVYICVYVVYECVYMCA